MSEKSYSVVVKDTERGGWFWRVAEDWPNGRGWHGEEESAERAAERASARLAQAIASSEDRDG